MAHVIFNFNWEGGSVW